MTMIHLKRTLGEHLLSAAHSQTEASEILMLHIACNRFQVTPQFTGREAWLECHPKKTIAHDILGAPDQIFQGTVIIKMERYEEHIPIYFLAVSKESQKRKCASYMRICLSLAPHDHQKPPPYFQGCTQAIVNKRVSQK